MFSFGVAHPDTYFPIAEPPFQKVSKLQCGGKIENCWKIIKNVAFEFLTF